MNFSKQMGKNLVLLREEKGLTQREFAEALNISISSVQKYEIGDRIPRDYLKIEIANFYEKKVVDIFFNDKCN
ncbi:MAG: helix-turn-helix transcriptional regulator [Eubacteriaceae bacterium]